MLKQRSGRTLWQERRPLTLGGLWDLLKSEQENGRLLKGAGSNRAGFIKDG